MSVTIVGDADANSSGARACCAGLLGGDGWVFYVSLADGCNLLKRTHERGYGLSGP